MFILIVKHENEEWDATLHTSRAEAEQAIRDLSLAFWIDTEGPEYGPAHLDIAGCIDDLATGNEHVKLFRADPDKGFIEGINFEEATEHAA